jgi:tetratricopeptide (TPR) repeat protein
MTQDTFGNNMTCTVDGVVAAVDRYGQKYLSYGPNLRDAFEAQALAPDDGFLNAHCAAIHMSLEAAKGLRAAEPFLETTKKNLVGLNDRERLFAEAVLHWAARDTVRALEIHKEISARWPADVISAKWGQYHAFNLGDAETMLWLGEQAHSTAPEAPYVKGMLAFGLEQCHRLDEAEEMGRAAVQIERADPWAHHGVAHVLETQGRLEDGIAWMVPLADTWDKASIFIREHNWWHVALYHLDLDEPQKALAIFDKRLWGEWPEFGQEQIGAISFLWRLHLRGVDVGDRWAPVVQAVSTREYEHIQPFHDLHYVFALAYGGSTDQAEEFLASMAQQVQRLPDSLTGLWNDIALPLARGISAYAQGDFAEARALIEPHMDKLHLIGGSHAQRDLFVQSYIDICLKLGENRIAQEMFAERVKARPNVPSAQRQSANLQF